MSKYLSRRLFRLQDLLYLFTCVLVVVFYLYRSVYNFCKLSIDFWKVVPFRVRVYRSDYLNGDCISLFIIIRMCLRKSFGSFPYIKSRVKHSRWIEIRVLDCFVIFFSGNLIRYTCIYILWNCRIIVYLRTLYIIPLRSID